VTGPDWSADLHDAIIAGRRLRYLDRGTGVGAPLLLIHGLGGCWQWWAQCVAPLSAGRRVIAVDLPGFGASDPLRPPAEMATHAATLVKLLDALGVPQVVVCAHSMGGLVAMRLAVTHRERVGGVVLVCAGGIHLDPVRLKLVMLGFRAFHAAFAQPRVARAFALRPRLRRRLFASAIADPAALDPALTSELVFGLALAPGFLAALGAGIRVANEIEPEEVTVPVLLVWGDRDPILPVASARELEARLPNAHLAVIGGAGHAPMLERPDRLAALVGEFVSGLDPRPPVANRSRRQRSFT